MEGLKDRIPGSFVVSQQPFDALSLAHGRPLRRAIARLWEPWIAWAYGASFDRRTEEYVPEAGFEFVKAELVVDELVKLLIARVPK